MTDSQTTIVHVLQPGDVALAFNGERLETLLGSCVAVVLTDPRRTVGVMCHIVHVGPAGSLSKGDTAYAAYALQEMFTRLRTIGITPQLCHAFVLGGGNMFPGLFREQHVGENNIRWVMDFLRHHGIDVVEESVGGNCYRKVRWTVGTSALEVECVGASVDNK